MEEYQTCVSWVLWEEEVYMWEGGAYLVCSRHGVYGGDNIIYGRETLYTSLGAFSMEYGGGGNISWGNILYVTMIFFLLISIWRRDQHIWRTCMCLGQLAAVPNGAWQAFGAAGMTSASPL